jgi:hypothetical protein
MVCGLDTWRFFYQPQGQAYERVFQNWGKSSHPVKIAAFGLISTSPQQDFT